MVEEGLWRERRRKIARIYQRRQRHPCYGELIQNTSPKECLQPKAIAIQGYIINVVVFTFPTPIAVTVTMLLST